MNKKVEMLRYQKNSFGFWMCILAIICQTFSFLFMYHCLQFTPKMNTGIDIIVSILFLLFVFLASEKLKTYSITWSYITMGIGVANLIRLYTYFFSPYSGEDLVHNIPAHFFWISFVLYFVIAACLIAGGVVTIIKGKQLNAYLASLKNEEEVK